jgi:hypothetical protein
MLEQLLRVGVLLVLQMRENCGAPNPHVVVVDPSLDNWPGLRAEIFVNGADEVRSYFIDEIPPCTLANHALVERQRRGRDELIVAPGE